MKKIKLRESELIKLINRVLNGKEECQEGCWNCSYRAEACAELDGHCEACQGGCEYCEANGTGEVIPMGRVLGSMKKDPLVKESDEYGPGCGDCTSHFEAWCGENGGGCHACETGKGFVCHNGAKIIPWPKRTDKVTRDINKERALGSMKKDPLIKEAQLLTESFWCNCPTAAGGSEKKEFGIGGPPCTACQYCCQGGTAASFAPDVDSDGIPDKPDEMSRIRARALMEKRNLRISEADLVKLIQRVINEQDSPANPCEGSNICCVNREKTEMMEPVFDRYDEETGEYICKCPVGSRKVPCGGQDINESDLRRLVKRVINEDVSCKCMQMLITRYLNADGSCCEREEVSYSFVDCPCSGAGSGADAGAGPLTHPHAETAGRGKARELPPKIVNVEKNQYRIKDDGTPERIMS
tara:strand:- start:1194 stop:2429 length:1236 start_codon:yes stop_codon:yes gene_type:complete